MKRLWVCLSLMIGGVLFFVFFLQSDMSWPVILSAPSIIRNHLIG
jgi:hypothetical protein